MIRPGLNAILAAQAFFQAINLIEANRKIGISCRVVVEGGQFDKAYDGENYWGRLARLRQHVVDTYLEDERYVLWVDSDVSYMHLPNLLRSMLDVSRQDIVGALPIIEGTTTNYDTAGIRESLEHRSNAQPPYLSKEGIVPVESVGCCVLVPSWLHRVVKFEAMADDDPYAQTEWWSLCQGAKRLDRKVYINTDLIVYHANLPDYGEEWH